MEQENVIDSTNDNIMSGHNQSAEGRAASHGQSGGERTPGQPPVIRTGLVSDREQQRRYRSPSPVRREPRAPREKSLSPGSKEIRAYWEEQEEKKRRNLAKKEKEDSGAVIDIFDDKPVVEAEKTRHASGSSIDSIEKLRLQALETLKSRRVEKSEEEEVYVEKKAKKSKKKKDKDRGSDTLGLLEELLESRKRMTRKSESSSDSDEEERKRRKKKKKSKRKSSDSDSDSPHPNSELKKAWEEIKLKWEKKLKKKKVSESD